MSPLVLVVDDERKIRELVRSYLERAGIDVVTTGSGAEALELAGRARPDLVVLDRGLPDVPGDEVARELRRAGDLPILMLTARAGEADRVEGLELGADDYVTKPFFTEELIARIHAVTRRATGDRQTMLQVGDLRANLVTREVWLGQSAVELTAREFRLLTFLMRSPGRAFPRTQILEHVWGYNFDPSSNVVEVHIHTLRKKLDPSGECCFIETVRGVGYRFRQAPPRPEA